MRDGRVVVAFPYGKDAGNKIFEVIEAALNEAGIETRLTLQEPHTVALERASPEMLTALKSIVEDPGGTIFEPAWIGPEQEQAARAAIASAEGGAP